MTSFVYYFFVLRVIGLTKSIYNYYDDTQYIILCQDVPLFDRSPYLGDCELKLVKFTHQRQTFKFNKRLTVSVLIKVAE